MANNLFCNASGNTGLPFYTSPYSLVNKMEIHQCTTAHRRVENSIKCHLDSLFLNYH